MRIAYVCADRGVPVFGAKGCSVHVQQVLRAFAAKGVAVDLFATSLGGDPGPELRDVAVHAQCLPRAHGAEREVQAIDANGALGRRLLRAGRFDAVYERLSLFSFAGMEIARRCGIPGILEVNAPLIEEQIRHRRLLDVPSAHTAMQRSLAAARHVVAVSDAVAGYLEGFREATGKIVVVPNGADVDRIRPAEHPADDGTCTVGFVGTLKPWHAVDIVVAAAAEVATSLPGLRLLIAGDGPGREALQDAIVRAGLERRTRFLGAVRPERIPGVLRRMDVGVAPYADGADCYFSPLKVFEYMAAGLPVVATRAGQLASVVEHGRTGFLCAPGQRAEWVKALLELGGRPGLRRRIGRAGRSRVVERHSWAQVADALLELARDGQRPPLAVVVG